MHIYRLNESFFSLSFKGYYGKMPWASIPAAQGTAAIKQALATSLKIQGKILMRMNTQNNTCVDACF